MSWDSYIDNLLGHYKGEGTACIIGIDGSKWTTDAHANALKLSAAEASTIAAPFKSKDFSSFMASGVHAEGIKYQFLRGDNTIVLAKKKDHGFLTLQASKTAIVIGHGFEGGSQGNMNKAVGVIAEYLESLGM